MARVRSRLLAKAVAGGVCAAGLLTVALSAQDSVRRQGDARTPEADAKRQRAFSRLLLMRSRNMATLEIGDGEIFAHCGKIATTHADYAALENAAAGDVVVTTSAAAMKLRTGLDLFFGDVEIATGNIAPGYPGTYGMWLERTDQGWSLLFNDEADVWSTQRDPSHDVAEVPVDHELTDEVVEELKISLEQAEGGGVLGLAWGPHRWTAAFRVGARVGP